MNILNLDYTIESTQIPEFKRALNVKEGYKRVDFQICRILNNCDLSLKPNIKSESCTFFGWSITTPFDGRSFVIYGDINFTISSRNRLNITFPENSNYKATLIVGPKNYSKHQTNSFFQGIRVEKLLQNSINFTLIKEFVSNEQVFIPSMKINLEEYKLLETLDSLVLTPKTTAEIISKILIDE
jgi:hypothetical protein